MKYVKTAALKLEQSWKWLLANCTIGHQYECTHTRRYNSHHTTSTRN